MAHSWARDKRNRQLWRKLRAIWRDTLLLLREFAWPLFYFVLVMIGGGLLYFWLAGRTGQPVGSVVEAIYLVIGLTFLQPIGDFPDAWYLQIFYFLLPIIGIAILALGLADFGRLFFNRRARSKEWEMAVASTLRNHIVLIGLGHLGFRVTRELHELGRDVVVIELDPKADLIAAAREMHVPVIQDDGQRNDVLIGAGVAKASAIVICTQKDNLNLKIAFKARKLNPDIQVIIRIFDDDFAQAVQEQFGFRALSATRLAAPNFASAAMGLDITRPIEVEGEPFSLACLEIQPGSRLAACSVAEIEQAYDVSIVLVRHDGHSDTHPRGDRQLSVNDFLAVMAGPGQIKQLVDDNS